MWVQLADHQVLEGEALPAQQPLTGHALRNGLRAGQRFGFADMKWLIVDVQPAMARLVVRVQAVEDRG